MGCVAHSGSCIMFRVSPSRCGYRRTVGWLLKNDDGCLIRSRESRDFSKVSILFHKKAPANYSHAQNINSLFLYHRFSILVGMENWSFEFVWVLGHARRFAIYFVNPCFRLLAWDKYIPLSLSLTPVLIKERQGTPTAHHLCASGTFVVIILPALHLSEQ